MARTTRAGSVGGRSRSCTSELSRPRLTVAVTLVRACRSSRGARAARRSVPLRATVAEDMELLEAEHIAAVAATVALGALAVLAAPLWPERRGGARCRGGALGLFLPVGPRHPVAVPPGG